MRSAAAVPIMNMAAGSPRPLIITAISATVSAALIQKRPGRRNRSSSGVNRRHRRASALAGLMPSRRSSRVPSMKATPNTNTRTDDLHRDQRPEEIGCRYVAARPTHAASAPSTAGS
jgi:hypothetical protein